MRPYDLVYHQFACNTTCIPPVHQFHLSRFGSRRSGKPKISMILIGFQPRIFDEKSKTKHAKTYKNIKSFLKTYKNIVKHLNTSITPVRMQPHV